MQAKGGPAFRPALRDALFSPRSVALVGASDDVTKTASRPLRFLRQAGFQGTVYPINPRRDHVLGERAWPSLSALPEIPDHAYILAPTEAVIPAVEECGRVGIPVVTILASGFGEAGEEGRARERQLREIIARSGVRVVGPSSLGVVNLHTHSLLTANAAFAEPELPAGRIFVASHSGSMIGALVSRGLARGIGFSGLVSVGNEIDLSIGEICASTLDDPETGGYLLFLETIRKADSLRAFALASAERGKPIIAYKLGRSSAAAELAVSHTGALAGEDDVADAFLKDCGIARVETFEAALEALPLLERVPLSSRTRRPRVAIVTTTAGGAAMVVDQLGIRNIQAEPPTAETLGRLAAAGVDVAPARIIDLTLAGTRYTTMKAALDVLLTAPEFDLIVAVPGSSARFEPGLVVRPLIDCAGTSKPLAAFVVPDAPDALAQLTQAGIPNFRTPEACGDAIAAAFARRKPKPHVPVPNLDGAGTLLNELDAYAFLYRAGIPHASAVAVDVKSARVPAFMRYPVAVKILSDQIAHKSDAGGVVLGVGEVLIGYRIDPQVGPIVMLAAGGVLTEIYRDRALRMAPVDLETAEEMIAEVKALRALAGYRGKPAGDLGALASAIVALSHLATLDGPRVIEAEVNPLLVCEAGKGVLAVDAVVRLA
ncbi:MAG TPA: acetate--CoA ligase family protein [Micropepsaceae bacterium]|nr:acetate--CoA ligase family protein [Micropepsaceae bacterium]